MAEPLTVTRDQLRSVYRAIGVDTVDEWKDKDLLEKIAKLKVLKEPAFTIPDKKIAALYEELVAESAAKTKFVLADEPKTAEPVADHKPPKINPPPDKAKPKPPKKESKPKAAPKPKMDKVPVKGETAKPKAKTKVERGRDDTYESPHKSSYYKVITPLREDRGVGIAATVIEVLKGASEKEPLTKEAVWKALKKKFPKRDSDKMWTSVNNLIPTRLKLVRDIHVWKTKIDGVAAFWIPGNGSKPQPKKVVEAKPEPKAKKKAAKKETVAA